MKHYRFFLPRGINQLCKSFALVYNNLLFKTMKYKAALYILSVQFSSVAQSCPTLRDRVISRTILFYLPTRNQQQCDGRKLHQRLGTVDVKSWAGLDSLHAQHLKPPLWALYLPSCQSLKVCSQPHLHNDDLTFGGKACETHALFCSKVQGNESLLFVLFLSLKLFSNLQSDTFFFLSFF